MSSVGNRFLSVLKERGEKTPEGEKVIQATLHLKGGVVVQGAINVTSDGLGKAISIIPRDPRQPMTAANIGGIIESGFDPEDIVAFVVPATEEVQKAYVELVKGQEAAKKLIV